jgi:hemerythrin-like domain-containing protein
MLYATGTALQQTDFLKEESSGDILNQLNEVLDLFDEHAHTEDNFVLAAIEVYEPSVAALFEEEHVQDQELSNRLRSLLIILNNTTSIDERVQVSGAIRCAFIEFMVFNLQHMAKEESKLNSLLWKHFSDEALQEITQKILVHIPPATMEKYSKWMMRALSNSEIIHWLKEIKDNAPGFVFNGMLSLAENELSPERWHLVQANITEGAMLA